MLLPFVVGASIALVVALPLAWKWELGMVRAAVAVGVCALAAGAAVGVLDAAIGVGFTTALLLVAGLTLTFAGAAVLWRFYRDPERTSPDRHEVVVSPADGQVIYVHSCAGGALPVSTKNGRCYALDELVRTRLRSDDAVVVGIALNFLDVHVNRAPIAGTVSKQQRYPGRFASLKDPSAVFVNERSTTVVERPDLQVAVVLIASRLVRRIISHVREGDSVAMGQRIGAIRFGSQVDVVLPDEDVRVLVRPGQRVRAGETVIAEVVR